MDLSQIKNFIENLGLNEEYVKMIVEVAKPFLENILNIDNEAFDTIAKLIPKLVNGEIDLKKLLPLAIPIFLEYFSTSLSQKKSTEQNCSVEDMKNEELNQDLKNISPEAFSQLAIFLQNDNAS